MGKSVIVSEYFFLILAIVASFGLIYVLFIWKPFNKSTAEKFELNKGSKLQVNLLDLAKGIWLNEIEVQAVQAVTKNISEGPLNSENPSTTTVSAVSSVTNEFIKDFVDPYVTEIQNQNAKFVIESLLQYLEQYGNCPSVVLSGQDKESFSLISVRDNLVKVSLKDHTYHVVSHLIEKLKDTYENYVFHVPEALTIALAHDLGKIPEFYQTGMYNTTEHPLISEIKLAEILEQDKNPPAWKEHARTMVRSHHLKGINDPLGVLIQQSDKQARLFELANLFKDFTVGEFPTWVDLPLAAEEILNRVNVTQEGKWEAISANGVIYARPFYIYECFNKLRLDKKILDKDFIYNDATEDILIKIVAFLKSNGLTSPLLGENSTGRKFKIYTQSSKVTGRPTQMILIPLRLDLICELTGIGISEIEARKSGTLTVTEITT